MIALTCINTFRVSLVTFFQHLLGNAKHSSSEEGCNHINYKLTVNHINYKPTVELKATAQLNVILKTILQSS